MRDQESLGARYQELAPVGLRSICVEPCGYFEMDLLSVDNRTPFRRRNPDHESVTRETHKALASTYEALRSQVADRRCKEGCKHCDQQLAKVLQYLPAVLILVGHIKELQR